MTAPIAVERHEACPGCAALGQIAWHPGRCPFERPRLTLIRGDKQVSA